MAVLVMDLAQFKNINVRSLPVISIRQEGLEGLFNWKALPSEWFLYTDDHIVFVRKLKFATVEIFDSLGFSQEGHRFISLFSRFDIQVQWGLQGEMLQKTLTSDTCALHAVLFSLGWKTVTNHDEIWLKRVVWPGLIQMRGRSPDVPTYWQSMLIRLPGMRIISAKFE